MYSYCDPVYSSDILKVSSDLKTKGLTYLPNLVLMGRSTGDIFKDGLTDTCKVINYRNESLINHCNKSL